MYREQVVWNIKDAADAEDLEDDFFRRNVAINATAWPQAGGLADPFQAREDRGRGFLRCAGRPEERFRQDALGILQALRLSAEWGLEIEADTEKAMFQNKELLTQAAGERLWREFRKLIVGNHAQDVIQKYVDIIGAFIPELLPMKGFAQNNPYHSYDVLTHSVMAMQKVEPEEAAGEPAAEKVPAGEAAEEAGPAGEVGEAGAGEMAVRKTSAKKVPAGEAAEEAAGEPAAEKVPAGEAAEEAAAAGEAGEGEAPAGEDCRRLCLKMAALFHDVGKPETYTVDQKGVGHFYGHGKISEERVRAILLRLKVGKALRERIALLVRWHDVRLSTDRKLLKRWMDRLTPELLLDLISLQQADSYAKTGTDKEKKKFSRLRSEIEGLIRTQG